MGPQEVQTDFLAALYAVPTIIHPTHVSTSVPGTVSQKINSTQNTVSEVVHRDPVTDYFLQEWQYTQEAKNKTPPLLGKKLKYEILRLGYAGYPLTKHQKTVVNNMICETVQHRQVDEIIAWEGGSEDKIYYGIRFIGPNGPLDLSPRMQKNTTHYSGDKKTWWRWRQNVSLWKEEK